MAPLYDIRERHTFLEFTPMEEVPESLRKSWSCPTLKSLESISSSDYGTETSELLPPAPSSASTEDGDSPCRSPNGSEQSVRQQPKILPEPCRPVCIANPPGSGVTSRRTKTALAVQMKLNKQLMAADRSSRPDVFSLVRMQLHRMNAVNLSTSIHRLVRLGGAQNEVEGEVLMALLLVIEKHTRSELELQGGTMPAKCATIIAWSCANLQVYRCGLFASLIEVAQRGLETCQDFEVTNLLWACSQFLKRLASENAVPCHGQLPIELAVPLHNLVGKLGSYYHGRLHTIKGQILVSALVSLATLSSVEDLAKGATSLFVNICGALALKSKELSFNNKNQVGVALQIIGKHHDHVLPAVSESLAELCPGLAAYSHV